MISFHPGEQPGRGVQRGFLATPHRVVFPRSRRAWSGGSGGPLIPHRLSSKLKREDSAYAGHQDRFGIERSGGGLNSSPQGGRSGATTRPSVASEPRAARRATHPRRSLNPGRSAKAIRLGSLVRPIADAVHGCLSSRVPHLRVRDQGVVTPDLPSRRAKNASEIYEISEICSPRRSITVASCLFEPLAPGARRRLGCVSSRGSWERVARPPGAGVNTARRLSSRPLLLGRLTRSSSAFSLRKRHHERSP